MVQMSCFRSFTKMKNFTKNSLFQLNESCQISYKKLLYIYNKIIVTVNGS